MNVILIISFYYLHFIDFFIDGFNEEFLFQ